MMVLRSGVDILEIARLSSLKPEIRQRFLERVFTPLELAQIGHSDTSMAGRFAAKEAVAKALGTGIGPVSWKEIEIQRGPAGEPVLKLSGKAQQLSETLGLETWSISISHTNTYAVALAVAAGQLASERKPDEMA